MWKRMEVSFACGFLLIVFLQSTQALSISMPDFETWGRASPLIVTAKESNKVQYEIINEYSFFICRTYEVVSVEKDIISDYDIAKSEIIKVRIESDIFDYAAKNTAELIQSLKDNPRRNAPSGESRLLCLTLDKLGKWIPLAPRLRLSGEQTYEEMRSAGLFKPVGIDGTEAIYTLAEWQKIADADIHREYYELNFSEKRPEDWPNTFEEAVIAATAAMENSKRIPMIGIHPFQTIIYEPLGLVTPRDKKRNEWQINKMLLLNMGRRIPPNEAKSKILEAAMAHLGKNIQLVLKTNGPPSLSSN